MKFGPLFPRNDKAKAEKTKKDNNHQLIEANVRLQAVKKKYKIMIERDLKQIKYSKMHKQENPKAV